jgi:hypothetical protein
MAKFHPRGIAVLLFLAFSWQASPPGERREKAAPEGPVTPSTLTEARGRPFCQRRRPFT